MRQLASVLLDVAGNEGIPLRWGGEEFLVVDRISAGQAGAVAERIAGVRLLGDPEGGPVPGPELLVDARVRASGAAA